MITSEAILGLPGFQITGVEEREGTVRLPARYTGPRACPDCGGADLRNKGRRTRRLQHESWETRRWVLELEALKWQCRQCGRCY